MLPRTLWFGVLSAFALQALSSPVATGHGDKRPVGVEIPQAQVSLQREYENGELPPEVHTPGWVDPRLHGGRLLDVCPHRRHSDTHGSPHLYSTRPTLSASR